MMILDYIDNLEFNDDEEDYLFDAQMTLARLSQGLSWLYGFVYKVEQKVREEASKNNVVISIIDQASNTMPDWLPCAFQWYSVSLYNYIRLVGWLYSKDKGYAIDYVNRIIPNITEYRHKISAHFAITYPKGDNSADIVSSIFTDIVYAHGYLRAGARSEILTDDSGNEIRSKNKTTWSLTKTHRLLKPRYWPNGPMQVYNSMRISGGATRKFRIDWDD